MSVAEAVLAAYSGAAARLIDQWAELDPAEQLAPVRATLPKPPARVLDLGAGPGQAAGWFAAKGYRVTAVEPVAEFRRKGAEVAGAQVRWIDDLLPGLLRTGTGTFDVILLNGVWHHLPPGARVRALVRLRRLSAPGARVILSLRHGPLPDGRPIWPVPPGQTVAMAEAAGFRTVLRRARGSIQEGNRVLGVTWTWLVLTH